MVALYESPISTFNYTINYFGAENTKYLWKDSNENIAK